MGESTITDHDWRFFLQLIDWLHDRCSDHTMLKNLASHASKARALFKSDPASDDAYGHCYDALDVCTSLFKHFAT